MSSKTKPPGTELNFEKAMDRLEAIVEQMDATTVVLPGMTARVDAYLNLILEAA